MHREHALDEGVPAFTSRVTTSEDGKMVTGESYYLDRKGKPVLHGVQFKFQRTLGVIEYDHYENGDLKEFSTFQAEFLGF